jgi:anti-sigma factor RsiW
MDVALDTPLDRRCQRARQLLSLAVDDEIDALSEHELASHLRVCPLCSAFSIEVEAIVGTMRQAAGPRLSKPIEIARVPQRARRAYRLPAVAAAVLALAAATGLNGSSAATNQAPQTTGTFAQVSTQLTVDASAAGVEPAKKFST